MAGPVLKLYYSIKFDGVLQSRRSALAPLRSQFVLPTSLVTYNLAVARQRTVKLAGYRSRNSQQLQAYAAVFRKAWEEENPG